METMKELTITNQELKTAYDGILEPFGILEYIRNQLAPIQDGILCFDRGEEHSPDKILSNILHTTFPGLKNKRISQKIHIYEDERSGDKSRYVDVSIKYLHILDITLIMNFEPIDEKKVQIIYPLTIKGKNAELLKFILTGDFDNVSLLCFSLGIERPTRKMPIIITKEELKTAIENFLKPIGIPRSIHDQLQPIYNDEHDYKKHSLDNILSQILHKTFPNLKNILQCGKQEITEYIDESTGERSWSIETKVKLLNILDITLEINLESVDNKPSILYPIIIKGKNAELLKFILTGDIYNVWRLCLALNIDVSDELLLAGFNHPSVPCNSEMTKVAIPVLIKHLLEKDFFRQLLITEKNGSLGIIFNKFYAVKLNRYEYSDLGKLLLLLGFFQEGFLKTVSTDHVRLITPKKIISFMNMLAKEVDCEDEMTALVQEIHKKINVNKPSKFPEDLRISIEKLADKLGTTQLKQLLPGDYLKAINVSSRHLPTLYSTKDPAVGVTENCHVINWNLEFVTRHDSTLHKAMGLRRFLEQTALHIEPDFFTFQNTGTLTYTLFNFATEFKGQWGACYDKNNRSVIIYNVTKWELLPTDKVDNVQKVYFSRRNAQQKILVLLNHNETYGINLKEEIDVNLNAVKDAGDNCVFVMVGHFNEPIPVAETKAVESTMSYSNTDIAVIQKTVSTQPQEACFVINTGGMQLLQGQLLDTLNPGKVYPRKWLKATDIIQNANNIPLLFPEQYHVTVLNKTLKEYCHLPVETFMRRLEQLTGFDNLMALTEFSINNSGLLTVQINRPNDPNEFSSTFRKLGAIPGENGSYVFKLFPLCNDMEEYKETKNPALMDTIQHYVEGQTHSASLYIPDSVIFTLVKDLKTLFELNPTWVNNNDNLKLIRSILFNQHALPNWPELMKQFKILLFIEKNNTGKSSDHFARSLLSSAIASFYENYDAWKPSCLLELLCAEQKRSIISYCEKGKEKYIKECENPETMDKPQKSEKNPQRKKIINPAYADDKYACCVNLLDFVTQRPLSCMITDAQMKEWKTTPIVHNGEAYHINKSVNKGIFSTGKIPLPLTMQEAIIRTRGNTEPESLISFKKKVSPVIWGAESPVFVALSNTTMVDVSSDDDELGWVLLESVKPKPEAEASQSHKKTPLITPCILIPKEEHVSSECDSGSFVEPQNTSNLF